MQLVTFEKQINSLIQIPPYVGTTIQMLLHSIQRVYPTPRVSSPEQVFPKKIIGPASCGSIFFFF
jgi:hypothetical protein